MGQPTFDDPVLTEKILSAATIYEDLLSKYANKKVFFLKDSPLKGQRGRIWKGVVAKADELGVDYRFWIQANFYWFHEWYRCAPKPTQLATEKAIDRVRRYRNLCERGFVDPNDTIHGPVHPTDKSLRPIGYRAPITPQIDAYNKKVLQNLQAAHPGLDEAGVIQTFANMFNRTWLLSHPTYQKLKEQKKL